MFDATPVVMPFGLMHVIVVMNVGLRTLVSVRLRRRDGRERRRAGRRVFVGCVLASLVGCMLVSLASTALLLLPLALDPTLKLPPTLG